MPRRSAARTLLPPVSSSTRVTYQRFITSSVVPAGGRARGARESGRTSAGRVGAPGGGQIVGHDHGRRGQRDRALDHVLELAHVAGPVVADEQVERLAG